MRFGLHIVGSGALAIVVVLVLIGGSVMRLAPPANAAPAVVFGPPTLVKKAILQETSIDGPALWQPNIVSDQPGTGPGVVLAWTGTDTAHRLNTLVGGSSLVFGGKHIYSEFSFTHPAVTTVFDGGIAVAWTGTNPGHSPNVLCNGCGTTPGIKKLTLFNESTAVSPGLAFSGGKLWLAWTGTDANNSLNVLPIDVTTFQPGTKTILRQFSSLAGPSLAPDPNTKGLLLSWVATSPAQRIRFATSPNGVTWTQPASSPLAEWSASTPSMLALAINNMPHYFLAWTGIDPHHSLNVQYTETFPAWPRDNAKTTLGELGLGGPSLAYGGVTRQVMLAWTGTDQLHRVNVANIAV